MGLFSRVLKRGHPCVSPLEKIADVGGVLRTSPSFEQPGSQEGQKLELVVRAIIELTKAQIKERGRGLDTEIRADLLDYLQGIEDNLPGINTKHWHIPLTSVLALVKGVYRKLILNPPTWCQVGVFYGPSVLDGNFVLSTCPIDDKTYKRLCNSSM